MNKTITTYIKQHLSLSIYLSLSFSLSLYIYIYIYPGSGGRCLELRASHRAAAGPLPAGSDLIIIIIIITIISSSSTTTTTNNNNYYYICSYVALLFVFSPLPGRSNLQRAPKPEEPAHRYGCIQWP